MLFIWIFLILWLAGCAQQTTKPQPAVSNVVFSSNETKNYIHTIQFPGETLALMAAWYAKDSSRWLEIAAANPGVDPNRLRLGQQIVIPESLLKERNPMPESFVAARTAPASVSRSAERGERTEPAAPSKSATVAERAPAPSGSAGNTSSAASRSSSKPTEKPPAEPPKPAAPALFGPRGD